jgi:SH3-like domain-containing protein
VLRPKLASIRLLAKPSDEGVVVTTLTKADEMIFLGKEQEGYLQVETGKGSGWVKKILIAR